MKQVTLHIPDEQYSFFMELVLRLGFAKETVPKDKMNFVKQGKLKARDARELLEALSNDDAEQALTGGFREAVHQINLVKQGKLKARDARELLDEL